MKIYDNFCTGKVVNQEGDDFRFVFIVLRFFNLQWSLRSSAGKNLLFSHSV